MAAEVVEFEMVDSRLENGSEGDGPFLHQENGKLENGELDGMVEVNDSGLLVSNGDETIKREANGVLDANFPKDAAEEWPVPEQIHSFYFVKHRMYDDPEIKAKIDQADNKIRKRNKVRFRLAGELKAKRARRADLITWLKSLRNEEKQYRAILSEKAKEIKSLHQALGKLRYANSSFGGGICNSEEDLDGLINSFNYRIQHESISLSEEKKLLREIKQLEGTREKVIANAAMRAKIEDSLGHKEAIQDQLKLIGSDMDEIRKEQQIVSSKIKELDDELETINSDITALQEEMNLVTEKRDSTVERIRELRSLNAHKNSSFFECRKVISLAKHFALTKDIKALEDLWYAEVEKFMSQWNSSKSFRDEYEKRILPSLENGQLGKNDEKPKVEVDMLASSKSKTVAKNDAKSGNGPLKLIAYDDISPNKKARQEDNGKVTSFEFDLDYTNVGEQVPVPENPMKDLFLNGDVDIEKLRELKREEEIAKAKQAMERKKKLAEKAAAKAALKAQKEAERKNKEREKKAKKKGTTSAITAAEELDEIYGLAVEQDKDESKFEAKVENPAPVQEKVQKENHMRHRINKQKVPEPIPKVILKRRKSSNFWVWLTAAAILALFIMLAVLGYQSLP